MFFMTLGVALYVRSNLGSGVISALPMSFSLAGEAGLVPGWPMGGYPYIMNAIFVAEQVLVLRRKFEAIQLFQVLVGFVFGTLLDISMWITSFLSYEALCSQKKDCPEQPFFFSFICMIYATLSGFDFFRRVTQE